MADDTQTPEENEALPQTPEGAGQNGEPTPQTPQPAGVVLTPEEQEEYRQFQEIKATTGLTKFSESAKEAIRLKNELQQAQQALTEKELVMNNPDYENLTDAEKENRKLQLQNQKKILELEAKEKWRDDFKQIPADIKELISKKGGEEAFKSYACNPARAGADLTTLAHSFVFDIVRGQSQKGNPGPGIERAGTPLPQQQKPKEGMTASEAATLRKTNPAKYAKLVQEKRLKIVD